MTAALELAAAGFSVFPVRPGKKLPAIKKWPTEATTDETRIRQWWARNPGYNVGIYTGHRVDAGARRHLVVLDLDRKPGIDGAAELARLALPHGGLPPTRVHETPTQGQHVFLYASRPVGTNAGALAPGVDVRGVGGFVVGPGSTVVAGQYRVLSDVPIADCPAWLEDRLPAPGPAAGGKGQATTKLPGIDPERATARAIDYLSALGPVGEGERNNAAFRVAAKVKDAGVDPDECVALMLEHWPCEPMLDLDELQQVVRSAYTNSANPQGADAAEAVFEPVDLGDQATKPPRYRLLSVSDLLSRKRPSWLVRGVLPAQGLAVVYGPPASGKSFLVLDLAATIARGKEWAGQRAKRGAVVYLALEGTMRPRVEAYVKANELDSLQGLHVIDSGGFDLLEPNGRDVKEFIAAIQDAGIESVALVIVDTLNRAMPGGNENASEDMGRAIRGAGKIAGALSCLTLFVHHSAKQEASGARGHSSLLGAADAELKVSRGLDGQTRFVDVTKVKDGEDGLRFSFQLRGVDLGAACDYDPDAAPGERDSSCVVEGLTRVQQKTAGPKLQWTAHRTNAMASLRRALDNQTGTIDWEGEASCSVDAWRAAFYELAPLGADLEGRDLQKARDTRAHNFANSVAWLTAQKLVRVVPKGDRSEYQLASGAYG